MPLVQAYELNSHPLGAVSSFQKAPIFKMYFGDILVAAARRSFFWYRLSIKCRLRYCAITPQCFCSVCGLICPSSIFFFRTYNAAATDKKKGKIFSEQTNSKRKSSACCPSKSTHMAKSSSKRKTIIIRRIYFRVSPKRQRLGAMQIITNIDAFHMKKRAEVWIIKATPMTEGRDESLSDTLTCLAQAISWYIYLTETLTGGTNNQWHKITTRCKSGVKHLTAVGRLHLQAPRCLCTCCNFPTAPDEPRLSHLLDPRWTPTCSP